MRDARSGRIRPSRSPSPAPSPTACSTACRAARCVREATTWPTSSPARGGESAPTSGVCGARTSTRNGGGIDGLHRPASLGAGDDQRGAGFVDEDRVDFADDHEVVAPLDAVARLPGQVVAQVVEAEFVVRPVGDVGLVFFAAFVGGLAGEDAASGQTFFL